MAYIKIVIEEILELELFQLLQDITIIILRTIYLSKETLKISHYFALSTTSNIFSQNYYTIPTILILD